MVFGTILILFIGLVSIDFEKIDKKRYYLILAIGFIVTRVLSIVYWFGVAGHHGTGDLNNIFGYQANQVIQGNMPYLDFESHYSPYFPYLISLPYLVYNQPVSVLSLFVVFDFLTLIIGGIYVSETWNIKYKHMYYWIYSYVPLTWVFITFWNQDEVISAFFIILSMLLIHRNQEWKAAIFMGLGFLVTKFLILVFFIPLFLLMKKPIRNGFLTLGLILIGYLPFIALGADVLMPFTAEAGYYPVGANPWVIFDAIGLSIPWYLPHIIVLVCLFTLALLFMTSNRLHYLSPEATIVLFSLVYMLISKKSFSFYVPFFLVFVIIIFMRFYDGLENKNGVTILFVAYLISFSLLYQSVWVFRAMQVLTIDWYIAAVVYTVALVSQILLIWTLLKFQYREHEFYYWRLDLFIKSLLKQDNGAAL